MPLSSHNLTLLGAFVALVGTTLFPWASVAGQIGIPGYALWPTGQVVAGLALLVLGLTSLRLWRHRGSLDGPIAMASLAQLVWLITGSAMSASIPQGFVPDVGVWISALGAGVASMGALRAYVQGRLRLRAEVSIDGSVIDSATLASPGSWRAVDPSGSRPSPVFQLDSAGSVAMGVPRADAQGLRVRGQTIAENRWLGDPQGAVQAFMLAPGDWGVFRVGETVTRFELTGETLRGRPDRWAAASVVAVVLTQITLLGLPAGQSPWDPASAKSAMPSSVLLDSRPSFKTPAPPAGVSVPFQSSALSQHHEGAVDRATSPSPDPKPLPAVPARGSAANLTDLLANPGTDSLLAKVLATDHRQAKRLDDLFKSDGTPIDVVATVLPYVTGKVAVGRSGVSALTDPSLPTTTRLSSPKSSRTPKAVSAARLRATAVRGSCAHLDGALRRRAAAFRACLTVRRRLGAAPTGYVKLGFMVAVGGAMSSVAVRANTTGDQPLARCLARRARQLRLATTEQCAGAFTFHISN